MMSAIVVALSFVSHFLHLAGAVRSGWKPPPDTELRDSHPIHLLVTRHGLSCTNVVQKWGSKYDFGRGSILDPLLSGAGEYGAESGRKEVTSWLSQNNLSIDVVVSSVLARAMQTALLMFPEYTKPLYVVPYIREQAYGSSNAPKDQKEQVLDLSHAVKGNFTLNYEWVDVFGKEEISWESFEGFLRQSFIPQLLPKLQKPPGSPIVIAVVTHSKFMRDSYVGRACKSTWTSKGASKPLNNQVVEMTYRYHLEAKKPDIPDHDVTPLHILSRSADCREVAGGLSLHNESPGCMSDIGSECVGPINQYALSAGNLWRETTEHELVQLVKSLAALHKEMNSTSAKKATYDEQLLQSKKVPQQCESTWGGCSPEEYCSRPFSGFSGCTLRKSFDTTRLTRKVAESVALQQTQAASEWEQTSRLQALKDSSCWAGGKPNPRWYLQLLGDDLSGEERSLLLD